MRERIKSIIKASQDTKASLLSDEAVSAMSESCLKIVSALKNGGKVLIFGNGGSAADSQHMAAELVGRFKKERKGLSAIALSADTSILTAVSNDYGYETSFKRQIEALGKKGDVAIAISTSGEARNVIEAVELARGMGIFTIALTGRDGGRLRKASDLCVIVKSPDTPRIQEAHILVIHVLCELVEDKFAS